jgi:hypothetical protein
VNTTDEQKLIQDIKILVQLLTTFDVINKYNDNICNKIGKFTETAELITHLRINYTENIDKIQKTLRDLYADILRSEVLVVKNLEEIKSDIGCQEYKNTMTIDDISLNFTIACDKVALVEIINTISKKYDKVVKTTQAKWKILKTKITHSFSGYEITFSKTKTEIYIPSRYLKTDVISNCLTSFSKKTKFDEGLLIEIAPDTVEFIMKLI